MTTPERRRRRERISIALSVATFLTLLAIGIGGYVRLHDQQASIGDLAVRICHGSNASRRQSNARAPLERAEAKAALIVASVVADQHVPTPGVAPLDPAKVRDLRGLVHRVALTNCDS